MSRRIPYPSSGSFNPLAISNKEAHILNGNINNLETEKLFEEIAIYLAEITSIIITV